MTRGWELRRARSSLAPVFVVVRHCSYDFTVDWWSFGCLVYEFVYGKCPFRTEKARQLDPTDKQKSIDMATLQMDPDFDSPVFSIPLISLLTGALLSPLSPFVPPLPPMQVAGHLLTLPPRCGCRTCRLVVP